MRYILWVAALLGACVVIENARHIGRHLGFLFLFLSKNVKNWKFFDAGHEENDITKHFAAFC